MIYYLKNNKSLTHTAVNIQKRINGKMFKYYTGLKVAPGKWDSTKRRIIKGEPDYQRKNTFLSNLEVKFNSIVLELKSNGKLNHDNLRSELDQIISRVRNNDKEQSMNFKDVWENIWLEILKIKRASTTVKKRRSVLNTLIEFQDDTDFPLEFDTIDQRFAEKYKLWALDKKKPNGDFRYKKDNSIHKNINITKEFMRWAHQNEYTTNKDFLNIKGFTEEYYIPFALTEEETKTLMELKFSKIDLGKYKIRPRDHAKVLVTLEKARDAFIFRSLCGIRHSDYSLLTPAKLRNNHLRLITRKTQTPIQIRLHPFAKEILQKYNYNVPVLTNQNENANLKLLGQIAGFDDIMPITYKRGGQTHEEQMKKWELISTHTARKTFITNCLRAGIDPYIVMEIVGIRKDTTFKRYIQVTGQDVNKAMDKLTTLFST